jgi:hypothetical protein
MTSDHRSSERRGPAAGRAPRSWLVAAVGLLVVAAIVVVVALALLGRRGGEPGSTILEIAGRANETSEPFYARQGWSIEWENTGEYFSYTIHGDIEFGQVITQNGPGNGVTSPVPTGTFFIEVVAQGAWSIKVVQGG